MKSLEILLPEAGRSANPPRLAGGLIDCLSSFDADEQLLEISGGTALSGNARLREFVSTVVKARLLEQLLSEVQSALFASAGVMGELRCVRDGAEHAYVVTEVSSPPKLKWKFRRAL
jgi:hypothetical protein